MKRLMMMAVLGAFAAGLLSGCNTVAGAGKDIQKAADTAAIKVVPGQVLSDEAYYDLLLSEYPSWVSGEFPKTNLREW